MHLPPRQSSAEADLMIPFSWYLQKPFSSVNKATDGCYFISTYFFGKLEKALSAKVPQQKNVYDCGIFTLYFMERFIHEAPQRLKKKDLDMFGSNWFRPEDASDLRKRIHNLLLEEFVSSTVDSGTEEGKDQSPSSSSEAIEELC